MTAYLLDTHALLWWVENDKRLSTRAGDAIAGAERVVVSDASLWELIVKCSIGKLELHPAPGAWFERHTAASRFGDLPIERSHLKGVADLPLHHRDPFDRILIAQARQEDLTIVTKDRAFASYEVATLW